MHSKKLKTSNVAKLKTIDSIYNEAWILLAFRQMSYVLVIELQIRCMDVKNNEKVTFLLRFVNI